MGRRNAIRCGRFIRAGGGQKAAPIPALRRESFGTRARLALGARRRRRRPANGAEGLLARVQRPFYDARWTPMPLGRR